MENREVGGQIPAHDGESPPVRPSISLPPPPKSRRRVKWILALCLLLAAFTAWVFYLQSHKSPPQLIVLPNGQTVEFMGATYSRRNIPPIWQSHLVSLLPKTLADYARKKFGAKVTQLDKGKVFDKPRLFLWFKSAHPSGGSVFAEITDENGIEAGLGSSGYVADGGTWCDLSFDVAPRRSGALSLALYPGFTRFEKKNTIPIAQVTFPSPAYGQYPRWKPEPLPTIKMAGDASVRLDSVTASHVVDDIVTENGDVMPMLTAPYSMRGVPMKTLFDLSIQSPRAANEVWAVAEAAITDATGNFLPSETDTVMPVSDEFPALQTQRPIRLSIAGALWPDESAWKLHLNLKKTFGFAPNEVVTFTNVPIPTAISPDFPPQTILAHGTHVVLSQTQLSRRHTQPQWAGEPYTLKIELPDQTNGAVIDVIRVNSSAGPVTNFRSNHQIYWNLNPSHESTCELLLLSLDNNATNLDITCAVQKLRSVEFAVKPPSPPAPRK